MRLFGRRVPYVPQMEIAECGAACLAMVLAYHRHHISLFEARQECSVSRDGASAYSIAKAAEARGLAVQAVRVDDRASLEAVSLPAIVHQAKGHFVVLERMAGGVAHVVDPAAGRRKQAVTELLQSSSGVVLTFSPTSRLVSTPRSAASRNAYLRTTWRHAPTTLLIFTSSLAVEILALAFPVAGQVLVDFVVRPRQEQWLWTLGAVIGAVTALRILLTWVRDRAIHALNVLLDLRFMTILVDRLLRLPMAFFQHRTTGDLMDRISTNLELRGLSIRIVGILLDGLMVVSYSALMLAYSVRLGAIAIVLSLLRLAFVGLLQTRGGEAALREQSLRGRETSALVGAFVVPELTKLSHVRADMVARYTNGLYARINANLERRRLTEGNAQVTVALNGILLALVIWVGGGELFHERITLGVFAAFLTIGALLQRPLEGLIGTVAQLGRLGSILARSDDVLDTPREPNGEVSPGSLTASIELDDVSFRYGYHNPDVVDRVSLRVREGEKIAIVGRTGAGKSTLARLMVGLIEPASGTVRFGGVDLRTVDLDAFRRQCGIVTQETFVFDDTIRNNIALKDPEVPLEEIRRAARLACIDGVIEALPDGYDTRIGQHGYTLSGGQRQRLAIARALVASPRILFLDEATSSLDLATEARVHANLAGLRCTRVVVAHRLATVRDADRICVLDGGTIVQEGIYDDLRRKPGVFRSMVEAVESAEEAAQ